VTVRNLFNNRPETNSYTVTYHVVKYRHKPGAIEPTRNSRSKISDSDERRINYTNLFHDKFPVVPGHWLK